MQAIPTPEQKAEIEAHAAGIFKALAASLMASDNSPKTLPALGEWMQCMNLEFLATSRPASLKVGYLIALTGCLQLYLEETHGLSFKSPDGS